MDNSYTGKSLLVLGSNVGSEEIVAYANEKGAHTIVADYYQPEQSPAKRLAREHFLISTADIDALSQLIVKKKIDAVVAGVSEFNLLMAQQLSERHNLPFFFNRKQWDMVENKLNFRNLCYEFNVPAPRTWYKGAPIIASVDTDDRVVVKPADGSSSHGVVFCDDGHDIKNAVETAARASTCGQIIVEEFFRGEEFTAHFVIAGGKAFPVTVDNRYPGFLHQGATSIPIARVYPCSFMDEFVKQACPQLVAMFESLNLNNAVAFVQGLYNADANRFAIFEAGLRCAGEAAYRITHRTAQFNFLYFLVDALLNPQLEGVCVPTDVFRLNGKVAAILSFASSGGTIGAFCGLNQLEPIAHDIVFTEQRYKVGDTLPQGDTLRQIVLRFTLVCDDMNRLAHCARFINDHVAVLDNNGNDMCIKFNPNDLCLSYSV